MRVFTSVGTTRFDELVCIFDNEEVLQALVQAGVTRLTVQHGSSPFKVPPSAANIGLAVCPFDYAPSLAPCLEDADVVFSHAATGIYLEAMQLRLPHFLIVNTNLHENHQAELAGLLADSTRCRAFADANAFRAYLLSGMLASDLLLMKNAAAVNQPKAPLSLLGVLSHTPRRRGLLGLAVVGVLLLTLACTL
ncbi:Glycosyltransferase family 28 [Giardia lamblia P15]|uniref:UDP-N-acetylglucosamine transferase subunit ALG13 n=1 Tax=Giardia intestinalis (strain P15) TaxID=658858 RepID=E1F6Y7_GIAIA|nr:Glycosyltransferase family 28 [Giardia lamblia P15]